MSEQFTRRGVFGFLAGAAVSAPAIVRFTSLMPVKALPPIGSIQDFGSIEVEIWSKRLMREALKESFLGLRDLKGFSLNALSIT